MKGERGTVTAFTAVVALAMVLATGLVLDGGEILAARRRAADAAASAARAGSQAVDETSLRRRGTSFDGAAAVAAARRHLAAAGQAGVARVRGSRVVVTATARGTTRILGLVGMRTFTVSATGSARIVRGVSRGET